MEVLVENYSKRLETHALLLLIYLVTAISASTNFWLKKEKKRLENMSFKCECRATQKTSINDGKRNLKYHVRQSSHTRYECYEAFIIWNWVREQNTNNLNDMAESWCFMISKRIYGNWNLNLDIALID